MRVYLLIIPVILLAVATGEVYGQGWCPTPHVAAFLEWQKRQEAPNNDDKENDEKSGQQSESSASKASDSEASDSEAEDTGSPYPHISYSKIDFGIIEVGSTAQQAFTLSNWGSSSFEVKDIESNLQGLTFSPSVKPNKRDTYFYLEGGDSVVVTASLQGLEEGTISGTINIHTCCDTHHIVVSAHVIAQQFPILGVESHIDFGTVKIGQIGKQSVVIENQGTAPLEVSGFFIEDDEILSNLSFTFSFEQFTLQPNESIDVVIELVSAVADTFSGTIYVLSNDFSVEKYPLAFSFVVEPLSLEERCDFNGDGIINIPDFLLFTEAYGSTDSQFDLDDNGIVDSSDLVLLVKFFGQTVT